MTPAAFVAIVEPHLPVGGYDFIQYDDTPLVELRRGDAVRHLTVPECERLFIGAIVAEWPYGFYLWRFGIGDDTYRCELHTCDESNGVRLHHGTASTHLEAALLARAAARKASTGSDATRHG